MNRDQKIIFEKYMQTRNISDEDRKFCENIDWHPVDEMPFKKEFLEKMKNIKKEKSIRASISKRA